jgi:hypothetical protein
MTARRLVMDSSTVRLVGSSTRPELALAWVSFRLGLDGSVPASRSPDIVSGIDHRFWHRNFGNTALDTLDMPEDRTMPQLEYLRRLEDALQDLIRCWPDDNQVTRAKGL